MSYFGTTDFSLEVALGNIPGYSKVNKFGEAIDCDSGVLTDIWDGADGVTSTDIWVAPTQARIHDIASTDANDDGDPVGTGMRTVKIFGLQDWDTAEVSETITLNGTTNVPTVNSYVIIHRIVGLTAGSGGGNAGTITATAQTDGTITAMVRVGICQTQMAIYGIPSTQTIHLMEMRADVLRGTSGVVADLDLVAKENAGQSDSMFVIKELMQFGSNTPLKRTHGVPKSFIGPCIIKMQATTGTNNATVTGAFDAYIVDN